MKILLIHSYYQQSGGEEVVFNQEREYLEKSEQVAILTFTNNPGFKGAIKFFLSVWNVLGAAKVKKTIREFQPDVIHIHNWHFGIGPIVIRVAKKRNIPVVLTMHNYRLICPSAVLLSNGKVFLDSMKAAFPWKAVWQKVYRNSRIQTFWLAFVIWFHKKIGTWKMVDKYIVLAEFEKGLFVNSTLGVPAEKIIVKPNFAHKPEVKEGQKGNHFLFIGRLSKEKGINVLLEAFKGTDYELHIGGKGPLLKEVQKAATEYRNIKYLGYLDKKGVQQAMYECTALVFPSIWYEGLPMTLIEAFALGKSIMVTKMGVMEIVIKHQYNGLQFEPGDPDDLRKQLNYWQNLDEAEKEIYRKNVIFVYNASYTPGQAMSQLINLYKAIVADKGKKLLQPQMA
jgi:glycosyltransferase involved in cell wall biosynthesis